ncbi:histone H1 [Sphingobacterium detergens]|uniref:histone H1 n=1 Tax=Sphingobacterium detergens TaxID=1145106 RepID=UPI003AAFC339
MSKFDQLVQEVEAAKLENEKFKKNGNKAAGTRLRNHLQAIKVLAQDVRKEVQEAKNSGK